MRSLLEQCRSMRARAARDLLALEGGRSMIAKELADGQIVDGTAERIVSLRETMKELDELIRQTELGSGAGCAPMDDLLSQ